MLPTTAVRRILHISSSLPVNAMYGAMYCISTRHCTAHWAQTVESPPFARTHIQNVPLHRNNNKGIEMLLAQQNVIWKSLNALEGWTSISQSGVPSKAMMDDLQQFCVFFKEYAEDIHFAMEEQMVFPLIRQYMKDALIPYHEGIFLPPDHDTVRRYIVKFGDDDAMNKDVQGTLQAISEFITFLREHSQNTAGYLYPDIEHKVPESVLQAVSNECEQFMEKHQEKEMRLLRICEHLNRKYGKDGAWSFDLKSTKSHKRM